MLVTVFLHTWYCVGSVRGIVIIVVIVRIGSMIYKLTDTVILFILILCSFSLFLYFGVL